MGAMASKITSLTIVYSTIYSASNAENVSIWWHHHVYLMYVLTPEFTYQQAVPKITCPRMIYVYVLNI